MELPQDSLAHRHAPDRRLSRRSLLGTSAAVTFAAAAGLFTAWTAHDEIPPGRILFERRIRRALAEPESLESLHMR